jgi:type VI protein secretion system component VasF
MKGMRAGLVMGMMMFGMGAWAQAPAAAVVPVSAAVPAEKAPMSEKQKQLLDQTNALLQLAAELKVSVDKSTKDQLSLDVVRKAEAVERMAKELKGKMK